MIHFGNVALALLLLPTLSNAETPFVLAPEGSCYFDNQAFSKGAEIVRDGARMGCMDGEWKTSAHIQCRYDDAVYSNGSVRLLTPSESLICKSGNWEQNPCSETLVAQDPVVVARPSTLSDFEICLLYDRKIDGDDAGGIALTIRDKSKPANAEHEFLAKISGNSRPSEESVTRSCIKIGVKPNEEVAVVQASGLPIGRLVSVCPISKEN
jgi:hypothetical protein